MGHYDYLYEDFTVKEVNEEILRLKKVVNSLEDKLNSIKNDISNVASEYTRTLLNNDLDNLNSHIKKYTQQINNWHEIKEKIKKGESFSYQQAHNFAENRW